MAQSPTPPRPPAGYVFQRHLFEQANLSPNQFAFWRRILRANMLALLPLSAGILLLWLPYQFYRQLGTPLSLLPEPAWSRPLQLALGLAALLLSIVLHEVLHGLALRLAGHRPLYLIRYGVPFADIRPGSFLSRRQYLGTALAPVLLMSLGGAISLLLLPVAAGQILLLVLLLNLAASIGDLYVAHQVWLAPAAALFAAAPEIQVFMPAGGGREESAG